MRNAYKLFLPVATSLIVTGLAAFNGCEGGDSDGSSDNAYGLTSDEVSDLKLLREEEKMARDLYLEFYRTWGLTIFNNIAASEQQHMDAILVLLNKYGVEDPAAGQPEGRFSSNSIQDLYYYLQASGHRSASESLSTGETVEQTDINDLNTAISRSGHSDIVSVYTSLRSASYNHLNAFENHP